MSDPVDLAQAREEEQRAAALAEQALRAAQVRGTGESAACCDGCGSTIPEGRRTSLPGVRLCVECQRDAEWDKARRAANGMRGAA